MVNIENSKTKENNPDVYDALKENVENGLEHRNIPTNNTQEEKHM